MNKYLVLCFLVLFAIGCKRDNQTEQIKRNSEDSISGKNLSNENTSEIKKAGKVNSDSIDSESAKLFSGVYTGTIHTYGTCVTNEAKANIFFDIEKSPITIVYDGTIMDKPNIRGRKIFLNGIELGKFEVRDNNPEFIYNGSINQWADEEGAENKSFTWTKIEYTSSLRNKYENYISEYKAFKKFWIGFKESFLNDDFDKISGYAKYPIIDKTGRKPANHIKSVKELKTFLQGLNAEHANNLSNNKNLNSELHEPVRFTDNDPCFPKEYIWISFSNYLVFQYLNGSFKITSLRLFE
ncbi:MAG: hypothetical protein NTY74_14530 [Ignavibacteriae bacterium]|nr:hypothetical protein [Ignavibacteriota bacterium]